jgi:hypothetical protein
MPASGTSERASKQSTTHLSNQTNFLFLSKKKIKQIKQQQRRRNSSRLVPSTQAAKQTTSTWLLCLSLRLSLPCGDDASADATVWYVLCN